MKRTNNDITRAVPINLQSSHNYSVVLNIPCMLYNTHNVNTKIKAVGVLAFCRFIFKLVHLSQSTSSPSRFCIVLLIYDKII